MSNRLFADDVLFLQRLLKASGLHQGGRIDGIWGKKTDAAVQAFETEYGRLAATLGTFDPRTESCIHTLALPAQAAARKTMAALAGAGLNVRIISGTRSYAEQDALYRQGRFGDTRRKVTNARGGQSNHNFGIAWDIALFRDGKYLPESPLYGKAGGIVTTAEPQVEWGGNWKTFQDMPHYQLATGLAIAEVRARFEQGRVLSVV